MRRLSIISHKGGAGKTSSAVFLAEDLALRGLRVVLIDADRQRGAGLLLGIEQPNGSVQQTRNPRLRYFCSTALPLRELPARAEDLAGLFDVAVVDTPSLDDPLAKAWIQLSSDALMVLPVEPLSIRTLEGADALLDGIRKLNPEIRVVGTLPTLFDQNDPNQRSLLVELMSLRPEGLLPIPIPQDPGITHRAQQKAEHRTEASAATIAAYAACGDLLVRAMDLGTMASSGRTIGGPVGDSANPPAAESGSAPPQQSENKPGASAPTPTRPAPSRTAPTAPRTSVPVGSRPAAGGSSTMKWAAILVAAITLLVLGVGVLMRSGAPRSDAGGKHDRAGISRPALRVAQSFRNHRG